MSLESSGGAITKIRWSSDDRPEADPDADRVREGEHAEVADAENDEDDAELGAAQRQTEAVERPSERVRQPVMDVKRRSVVLRGGAGRHQEGGGDHPAQHRVGDQGSPPGLEPGQRRQRRADRGRRLDRRVSGCGEWTPSAARDRRAVISNRG